MKDAALYIRVSTDDQLEYSPDAQKRILIEYAKKNSMRIAPEHIYIDEGFSGRKAEKRPSFMRMISEAKQKPRPFDVILVHKFDRFARSREDSIVYKSLLRKECGIQVISITEHIEDDKFSVILEAMLEAMAEYYSLNLAEEVKKGMTEKAMRGECCSKAPIGYRIENKKLVIDENTVEIPRLIFRQALAGAGDWNIAKQLNELGYRTNRGNLWENRTVKYVLRNPIYKGYTRWCSDGHYDLRQEKTANLNFIIVKGTHEPIVSESDWDAVQAKLDARKKQTRTLPVEFKRHWLSGLVRCSSCGCTLASSGKTEYIRCHNYNRGTCPESNHVSFHRMEKLVIEGFEKMMNTGHFYIVSDDESAASDSSFIQERIKRLDTKLKRAKAAYMDGIDSLDEYKAIKNELEAERDTLLKELGKPVVKPVVSKEKLSSVYNIIRSDAVPMEQKHDAIRSICHHIAYGKSAEILDFYLHA